MVWNSGWELASAVSNAGGLGLIGAGSMHPDTLRLHIQKCKKATQKPFGVNVPLLYPQLDEIVKIIIEEGVKIVFTSAGSPKKWTPVFKEAGIIVVHVIANSLLAIKCDEAGVDAIVAEGFEAGGHNGREETTTLTLIPATRRVTKTPLIAAGGITTGRQMLAAVALGAEGVQMGSRFAASIESSGHQAFKDEILKAKEGATSLALKGLVPVRLIKNKFWDEIKSLEDAGADAQTLKDKLGKGRAKLGMFEGNLDEGELEIGQGAALIDNILSAQEIIAEVMLEFKLAKSELGRTDYYHR
ncbi:MAG: hypothetical protein RIS47_1917 [Bacteroidota bacterium]